MQCSMSTGSDLVFVPKRKRFLTSLFRKCKATTIPLEEKFKRCRTHAAGNMGHVQLASTVCANHVLGEFYSLHKSCKHLHSSGGKPERKRRTKGKRRSRGQAKSTARKPNPARPLKRPLQGRDIHFREVLAEATESSRAERFRSALTRASAIWSPMPAAKKRKYDKKAKAETAIRRKQQLQVAQRKATSALFATRTPWQMGDDDFAYAKAKLQAELDAHDKAGTNFVKLGSEAWTTAQGRYVESSGFADWPPDTTDPAALCSERYGVGFCIADFTAVQRQMMEHRVEVMNSIVKNLDAEAKQLGELFVVEGQDNNGIVVKRIVALMIIP